MHFQDRHTHFHNTFVSDKPRTKASTGFDICLFVCLFVCLFSFLAGCGDFQLQDVSLLTDPCPLPDKQKKRSLNEREKLIYAPMAGVGGIVYDKVPACLPM